MLAQNLAHRAILAGHTARFVSAAAMLADLAAQDGPASLRRRLRHYTSPSLLVLDEVGYMSYGQGYADLLFQVISQRYQRRSTIVSTNRVFNEWSEVFPNATSIIALIDRLCHNAEIVSIDADSYRNKETQRPQRRPQDRPPQPSQALTARGQPLDAGAPRSLHLSGDSRGGISRISPGVYREHKAAPIPERVRAPADGPGPERLVIGPSSDHVSVMRCFAQEMRGPFQILYVLAVSVAGREPGRYQSPAPMELAAVTELLTSTNSSSRAMAGTMSGSSAVVTRIVSSTIATTSSMLAARSTHSNEFCALWDSSMGMWRYPVLTRTTTTTRTATWSKRSCRRWTGIHFPLVEEHDDP
jgi:hypothetical protein